MRVRLHDYHTLEVNIIFRVVYTLAQIFQDTYSLEVTNTILCVI